MKKLNLFCPFNSLSYGIVSKNFHKELSKDVDVFLHLMRGSDTEQDLSNYDKFAPCLKIWHANDLKTMIGKGEHVGFPIFELDKFTEEELHQINNIDRLVVATNWAKNVSINSGVNIPVDVVNLGVDTTIFNHKPNDDLKELDGVKFFNFGKWEIRKGHDALIKAFELAFRPDDKVYLLLNCHNPFIGNGNLKWQNHYKSGKLGDKVFMFEKRLDTQEKVAEFINSCDFGVFPARAEGWNLSLLESLACGKYCIATNNTGHTEYLNANNSLLIETPNMEKAYDGVFFNGEKGH